MRTDKLNARQGMEKLEGTRKSGVARPPVVSGHVPAKWRWHYRVLVSLQERLLGERRELRRAISEPLEPHSLDAADSATDEFDHSLTLSQLDLEQDALYEVNAALHRIADGTYGVCQESGMAIPAPRLRAIPWTRFTREVEEQLEKKGAVSSARLGKASTVRGDGRADFVPAVETEENAETPPNDETLSPVSPPRGQPVSARTAVRRPRTT